MRRASGLAGVALLGWAALVLAGAPALADETPTPTVTASDAGPASSTTPTVDPSGTPAPTPTDSTVAAPAPTDSAAAGAPTPEPTFRPVEVGGVLYVSGVRTELHPSWDPLGGTLHVELTVRNATDQIVDASASVGATTLLGIDLGGSDTLAVRGLEPGEIRVISTDIGGIGQWGVLKAHVTVTPPSTLGGVELTPLARERWLVAPPWYLVVLVVAVVAVVWVFRHYRLAMVPRRPRGQSRTAYPALPAGGPAVTP